jgi:ferredoxin
LDDAEPLQPAPDERGNTVSVARQANPTPPRDLLDNRLLSAFLRSRLWPAVIAYPTMVVFGYIVYSLLWGPGAASANVGSSLTWVFWWPLIPLAMFGMGRLWCAICPFGKLVDLVQKVAGLGRPVPPFLKRYGIWVIDGTFLAITWADHAFGIVESPRGSGYLLGLLVAASIVTAVVYERRAWCRYLCFLGGLSGNYSRTSAVQLRATPAICAKCKDQVCYKGNGKTPGCPVFEVPRAMASMANCNLCANCIKSCPNGSLRLTLRKPTSELWFLRQPKLPEAFLAVVIVGIVIVQNITMLSFWEPLMDRLSGWLFDSRIAAFTAVFAVAMALPFAFVAAASAVSAGVRRERLFDNFARFGYAVIPLDLGAHLAHNLFHLLAESQSILYNLLGVVGIYATGPTGVLPQSTIQVLQFGLLALGVGGSLLTAWKIAQRSGTGVGPLREAAPHLIVLVAFASLNVYLFTMPMAHRM